MFDFVFVALVLSYVLVVWLRTNAFVEYMHLFKLDRFFKIAEYLKIQNDGYEGNYIDFLAEYYRDSFFVRLVVCPVCLSFWLGLVVSFFENIKYSYCTAPLILFFYLIFNKLL